jgi:diguanylate cyclase (GGDEF)-like protein/PAS domain S-box-containing protein
VTTSQQPPSSSSEEERIRALEDRLRWLEQRNLELEREVAEHTEVEEALWSSEAEWRLLIETMPQIVWITRPDEDGGAIHFNHKWMDFTGRTLEKSLGLGWLDAFHPDDRARATARWAEAVRTGHLYEIEYRLRRADGVYHWMLGRAMPLRDRNGRIVKWFGTCTDIEDLKRAEERIERQARLLDQTQDAVVVHDLEHRIVYWNQGAERIYGWTAEEAVGRRLDELICPDIRQVDDAVDVLLREGEWTGELRNRDKAGNEVIMEGRWSLLEHEDGTPRAALAVNTDVTERMMTEARFLQELENRATHDPLTGLANRALLFDRLELLLGQRHGAGVAVAFIDLDDFKTVNDQLGHRVGDQLLVHVAERLQATIRQGDVAARIGGDEFVVVGEATDEATALHLGERLAVAVEGETRIEGATVTVSASVGVAYVDSDEAADADHVISRADTAMYQIKRQDPGSVSLGTRSP